jgi:hypothetical protein
MTRSSITASSGSPSVAASVIGVVAAVGALSALLVHSACVDPGPPVARPEPGTARAGYCGVLHGVWPWLLLFAAPVAVTVITATLARGRVRWWLLLVGGIAAAAALLNVFIVHSLSFAYTI